MFEGYSQGVLGVPAVCFKGPSLRVARVPQSVATCARNVFGGAGSEFSEDDSKGLLGTRSEFPEESSGEPHRNWNF